MALQNLSRKNNINITKRKVFVFGVGGLPTSLF
jgi:hypothetical protein